MTIRPESLVLHLSEHLGEPTGYGELNRWAMAVAAVSSEEAARIKAMAPRRPEPAEVPFGLIEQWSCMYITGDLVIIACVPASMTPGQLAELMVRQVRERLFKMAADDSVSLLGRERAETIIQQMGNGKLTEAPRP